MMNFSFIKKHPEIFTIIGLAIVFYIIFFHGIGSYPLMDVDETRYVLMSRDMFHSKNYLTLFLNGDYFFEKPPLYFWGEVLSFKLFGAVNEFTARFPVSFYGMAMAWLTYFMGRKIVSRNYGIVSALILATSFEYAILSRYAILDILVTACVGFSVYAGFYTFFCDEKNKKYFWWLFYIFSGLAVMAKGLPGFIVPFGIMFFALIIARKFKEAFRPQYFVVGTLLFLGITLPWHIIMLKMHDPLFFNEYIIKHHVARFFDSNLIQRGEPWYFYILTFLWGLIPWNASVIATIIAKIKNIKNISFKTFSFAKLDNVGKFLCLNWIAIIFIFVFFSSSNTKLITYVLPIYAPVACLMGWIWLRYIENNENRKFINMSVYIFNSILATVAFLAIFTKLYLPTQLYEDILPLKWFCILVIFTFPVIGIIAAIKNKRVIVFASYVLLTLFIAGFGTEMLYKLDYKFGQNDLMEYAKYAKQHKQHIVAFNTGVRYSLIYYGTNNIIFPRDVEYSELKQHKLPNTLIVIQKKRQPLLDEQKINYDIIKKGRKYMLIKLKD